VALSGALIGNGGLLTIGIQPAPKTAKQSAEKLGKLAILAATGAGTGSRSTEGRPPKTAKRSVEKLGKLAVFAGGGPRELAFLFWPWLTILPRP
jgi:hypothetical protein